MRRHRTPLYNFIYRSVRHPATSKREILQDAWIRILAGAGDFQRASKFTTWAYTVARNLCIDHARKASLHRHPSLEQPLSNEDGPTLGEVLPDKRAAVDRTAIGRELQVRIASAIDALPNDQREVFLMREYSNLQFKEIAEIVGAPENTVESKNALCSRTPARSPRRVRGLRAGARLTAMDCEACNNLLLDHLYEELDEVRSAAVRKHLDGCADCTAAFERLAGGRRVGGLLRPIDAPLANAALHEAIHAAAIANARPRAEGASEAVAPVIPIGPVSRIPRWMSHVGEMAMRRQVAMAAVFLLMVGFGLGYHQFQSPTRPVQLTDEPGAEVIPATGLPQPPPQVAAEGTARTHHAARPNTAEPHAERRDNANVRPTTASNGRVAELAQTAPPSPNDERARAVEAPSGEAQDQAAIPPTNMRGSPAAYRNLPRRAGSRRQCCGRATGYRRSSPQPGAASPRARWESPAQQLELSGRSTAGGSIPEHRRQRFRARHDLARPA